MGFLSTKAVVYKFEYDSQLSTLVWILSTTIHLRPCSSKIPPPALSQVSLACHCVCIYWAGRVVPYYLVIAHFTGPGCPTLTEIKAISKVYKTGR
jgi:hypothetical protein